ncbi:MAG: hypothetical protein IJ666_08565 [Ruminococcus sp.]|nr:hypothetical protein [Ruminococcus sp.]
MLKKLILLSAAACAVLCSCASDYSYENTYEEAYPAEYVEEGTEPETAPETVQITETSTENLQTYPLPDGVVPVTWQPSPSHLIIDTDESRELYARIKSGSYPTIEELTENNTILQIDELSMYYLSLYGNTFYTDTPERTKLREDIKNQFLSSGSARTDGGNITYDGELERNYQIELIVALPSSERTKISDTDSEEMKAFILDDIFIKQLIPEFQESHGCASDAVLYECSSIMDEAAGEFLDGDMKGINLVYPVMSKDLNDLTKNYIKPFEKAGYNVRIIFAEREENIAVSRCIAYELETGNIISSVLMFAYSSKLSELYEQLCLMYNSYGEPYCTTEPPTEEETTEEETEEENSEEEEENGEEENSEEENEENPEEGHHEEEQHEEEPPAENHEDEIQENTEENPEENQEENPEE